MEACDEFDLIGAERIVRERGFNRIALQFPDDQLHNCVSVQSALQAMLPEVLMFVTADSTWGSSVDDVSAMHYNADALLYFGSDLSSSGTIPVVVFVPRKSMDVGKCERDLREYTRTAIASEALSNFVVLYEPGYCSSVLAISSQLEDREVAFARMPPCADVSNWSPTNCHKDSELVLGGLIVEKADLCRDQCQIVYIGDKSEQLVNIMLNSSNHTLFWYSPVSGVGQVLKGSESIEFRERYGGVMKVRDAKIVGIIIGSMGLTADSTQSIVHRLQTLISAAKKKYYCFVMGRLNEAKLCNFPEVDIFCLVSNDDTTVIKPKTFHAPVITPFELELGLGAHAWNSSYLSTGALTNKDYNLEVAVEMVVAGNTEDSDSDADDGSNLLYAADPSEQQVSVFSSAAVDFFQRRDYQGLVAETPADQDLELRNGTFGIAAGYEQL